MATTAVGPEPPRAPPEDTTSGLRLFTTEAAESSSRILDRKDQKTTREGGGRGAENEAIGAKIPQVLVPMFPLARVTFWNSGF